MLCPDMAHRHIGWQWHFDRDLDPLVEVSVCHAFHLVKKNRTNQLINENWTTQMVQYYCTYWNGLTLQLFLPCCCSPHHIFQQKHCYNILTLWLYHWLLYSLRMERVVALSEPVNIKTRKDCLRIHDTFSYMMVDSSNHFKAVPTRFIPK